MTLIPIGAIILVTTAITVIMVTMVTIITITDLFTTLIITVTDVLMYVADATFIQDAIIKIHWRLVVIEPVEFPVAVYLRTEPAEKYVIPVPEELIEPDVIHLQTVLEETIIMTEQYAIRVPVEMTELQEPVEQI